MSIPVLGYAHVRLTVSDIARSRAFYDKVLGLEVAYEIAPDADEATKEALGFLFGGVIYKLGGGLFGLRPVAPASDTFDEDRAGLDHVSFSLASIADLEAAAAKLDSLMISHGGIKNVGAGSILEFRDPDNIALELFAPAD
jgi:glyoxylase I family protein